MPATEEQSEQVERQEAHVQELAPVDSSKLEVLDQPRQTPLPPAQLRTRGAPLGKCLPAPPCAALYQGGSGRHAGGGHTAVLRGSLRPTRTAAPPTNGGANRFFRRCERRLQAGGFTPASPAGCAPGGGVRQLPRLAAEVPRSLILRRRLRGGSLRGEAAT